jgi:ribose transport system substrate-binding protein
MVNRTTKSSVIALVVLAIALVASGCGSSSNSSTSSGGTNAAATTSNAPGVARAKGLVAKWYQGTYKDPSTFGSPKPATGKTIWAISCGQSLSSCARGTKGAVDAAKAIGWNVHVFDTKGDLGTANQGIRQAIAAKADGVFVYFIDCSYMKQGLQEAKKAGIPVVQAEGIDCNLAQKGAPSLFAWNVSYSEGPLLTWLKDFGRAMTSWQIANSNGKADILYIADNAAVGTKAVTAGFKQEIGTCTQCKSKVVEYSFDQMTKGLSSLVQDELLKNPTIDSVAVAYDAILQAGVSDGVQQAARTGRKIVLTAGEGQDPTMALLRKGVVSAGVGLDNEWESWSGIDALNRIFNGKKPVTSGVGIQLYDKNHNVPASGPYKAPIDFKAAYKKAWGVQ